MRESGHAWESGVKQSVVDYTLDPHSLKDSVVRMVVEEDGKFDTGSDHKLLWCVMKFKKLEMNTQQERFKWRVDGKSEWEEYQQAV